MICWWPLWIPEAAHLRRDAVVHWLMYRSVSLYYETTLWASLHLVSDRAWERVHGPVQPYDFRHFVTTIIVEKIIDSSLSELIEIERICLVDAIKISHTWASETSIGAEDQPSLRVAIRDIIWFESMSSIIGEKLSVNAYPSFVLFSENMSETLIRTLVWHDQGRYILDCKML